MGKIRIPHVNAQFMPFKLADAFLTERERESEKETDRQSFLERYYRDHERQTDRQRVKR